MTDADAFITRIAKVDAANQRAFGWANAAAMDPELLATGDIEFAVYDLVLRNDGVHHAGRQVGDIIESFVMTREKAAAMGVMGAVQEGWWVGVEVHDSAVFDKFTGGARVLKMNDEDSGEAVVKSVEAQVLAKAQMLVDVGEAPTLEQATVLVMQRNPALRKSYGQATQDLQHRAAVAEKARYTRSQAQATASVHPVCALVAKKRREAGLTQEMVAKSAGFDQPHISRIESGQVPTWDTLSALAETLDITVDDLRAAGVLRG